MDIDPTESTECAGPNTTASTLLADEGNGEEDSDEVDSAKVAHDEAAVKTISGDALRLAAEDGITMTESERSEALGLFSKASLARKVHDSPTLQEKFELCMNTSYLNRGNGDDDQKMRLDRRVPTRWNSDFACLKAHVKFQDSIRLLTAGRHGDLEAYALTPCQFVDKEKLAEELTEVLVIFQEITDLFSRAEVPLVHEVVPMLEDLEHQLDGVYRDVSVPNVIRIAARAALLMVGKYYALLDDNEVYCIAMERASDKQTKGKQCSKWALPPVDIGSSSKLNPDSMDAYLSTPLVPHEEIEAGGGYLQYWERQRTVRPRLAQMALDFLSVPASSVDAERAFSGGHLQMGHLQHGMSSQTFKGQVALGSWIGTPLMPDLDLATTIISSKMKPKRCTDKGKGKENADVLPTTVINVDSDSDVDM
ncbi:hypothetical protein EWM64_g6511 [Hericium alpestre]|uniref:HAT C-terminal dimerisation domain-containing protein n=1 Tax=Hericium alpestre TaxID=135208 RepID=A0A4Y9ZRT8_9AGAM|nr:hypothetical protein EWM64_g6511 [Hericium alpestre]